MKQKGWKSMWWWTHYVILKLYINHDVNIAFFLFFKFQFLTTYISGMGGPINMKQKEYE